MTSLVFPAYNPGPGIDRAWFAVRDFLRTRREAWDATFVLDGCTDGTPERLAALEQSAPDPRMHVLSYSPNRGKGFAVRTGLLGSVGDYRIFTDVDLAYTFDDVLRIAETLWSGSRIAIGSREHPDSTMTIPVKHLGYAYRRSIQSIGFRFVSRLLLPLQARDTQAGLKGMTATVAETLLPTLTCNGFGFDCELLTVCRRSQIPVTEVPVAVRYEDAASTTGLGTSLRMLRELWRIRRSTRTMTTTVVPPEPDYALNSRRAAA